MTAALNPAPLASDATGEIVEWADIATAAHAAGAMKPAWTAFLKRKFFVPILRSPDDNPKNYLLHFERPGDGSQPTLVISEVRERLDLEQGDGTVALTGLELLLRLDGQGAIDVTHGHGVFKISKKRADWLRSGIEDTKAKVVIRKLLQAAAPGGPFPVLRVQAGTEQVAPLAPVLKDRVRDAVETIVDARYFVPVTLSCVAISMLWVLAASRQEEPAVAAAAPAVMDAPAPTMSRPAPPPAPTAVANTALQQFTPWDNSFTVTLPGQAEEIELSPDQVAQMDGLPANYYRLQHQGVLYEMSAIHFGSRMPPDLGEEMDHRQQLLVGTDGRLMSAKPIVLNGATGREVRVRLADGSERLARYIFSGDKFCMVMVTTPSGMAATTLINNVLQSFQLAK